ncbi:hypothetical protein M9458_014620, partial [Cirrhinus mrigala]
VRLAKRSAGCGMKSGARRRRLPEKKWPWGRKNAAEDLKEIRACRWMGKVVTET